MSYLTNLHNSNPKLLSPDRVLFQDEIPNGEQIRSLLANKKAFLIYDENIPLTKKIINSYDHSLSLKTGEGLKTLSSYQKVLKLLIKNDLNSKQLVFVAMGGGSLGDFVGFVASTYKRGCSLIHIPSTWLAAVDSAHGGKTALNFNEAKNQIGSFYFPNAVLVSKKLLLKQPKALLKSAMGEVAKTYLYDDQTQKLIDKKISSSEQLFKCLPVIIEAKYKVVRKDPYEIKKIRKVLNLGHTIGHVLEAYHKLPHGEAIKYGLGFSLQWSFEKKYITESSLKKLHKDLKSLFNIDLSKKLPPMPKSKFIKLLKTDKKSLSSSTLDFIFIHENKHTLVTAVSFDEIISQAERQGVVL